MAGPASDQPPYATPVFSMNYRQFFFGLIRKLSILGWPRICLQSNNRHRGVGVAPGFQRRWMAAGFGALDRQLRDQVQFTS